MKLFSLRLLSCLAAAALVLSAAGGARAFTFEDKGADGAKKGYLDLETPDTSKDTAESKFKNENGRATFKSGNSTFYFGRERSFDQRYNPDKLFDPFARDGR